MKIVILGPAHPYRGGIAALNERLAKQLVVEGHDVTVYNFTLQYPGMLFPGKTQFTSDPAPQGLKILRKVNSVNPFNWWKVGRELKKMCPDIVVVRFWLPFMGPALGSVCRIVRKNHHTRIICIADNMIPHEKRIGDQAFTKYFAGSVDGFIAMSHEVYDDIAKLVKTPRRMYTPHPVYDHYGEIITREEALDRLGLDKSYHYILFFGFIRDYKGLDLLLEAMADAGIKERKIRLIVAGEFYSNEAVYLQMLHNLGLEGEVVMHNDYIPNEVINRYFCAADLIVQPYKTATQSGVTQVGYHFNKPMLVTDVGGLAEIIAHGKSGYVVPPAPVSIRDAIMDFYDNHREDAFKQETARLKQNFSWEKMTEAIYKLAGK